MLEEIYRKPPVISILCILLCMHFRQLSLQAAHIYLMSMKIQVMGGCTTGRLELLRSLMSLFSGSNSGIMLLQDVDRWQAVTSEKTCVL